MGAFLLGSAYRSFSKDTIHVAVVDSDVGTSRHAVLRVSPNGLFLAPDNGLLTYLLRDNAEYNEASQTRVFLEPMGLSVPFGYAAYTLSHWDRWNFHVSNTFYGRDIFASVAGHLSLGILPEEVGESLCSLTCLCISHPHWHGDTVQGYVIHIDRFGNLITIVGSNVPEQNSIEVLFKNRKIKGITKYIRGRGGPIRDRG